VTSFLQTFYGCQLLEGPLPAGLFRKNTEVFNFSKTFAVCHGLTGEIPAGFFKNNKKARKFLYTFNACRRLRFNPYVFVDPADTPPYDLFASGGFDLRGTFSYMSSLLTSDENPSGSVPRLWDDAVYPFNSTVLHDRDENYVATFAGIFAKDYESIPDEWKRYHGYPQP